MNLDELIDQLQKVKRENHLKGNTPVKIADYVDDVTSFTDVENAVYVSAYFSDEANRPCFVEIY